MDRKETYYKSSVCDAYWCVNLVSDVVVNGGTILDQEQAMQI